MSDKAVELKFGVRFVRSPKLPRWVPLLHPLLFCLKAMWCTTSPLPPLQPFFMITKAFMCLPLTHNFQFFLKHFPSVLLLFFLFSSFCSSNFLLLRFLLLLLFPFFFIFLLSLLLLLFLFNLSTFPVFVLFYSFDLFFSFPRLFLFHDIFTHIFLENTKTPLYVYISLPFSHTLFPFSL